MCRSGSLRAVPRCLPHVQSHAASMACIRLAHDHGMRMTCSAVPASCTQAELPVPEPTPEMRRLFPDSRFQVREVRCPTRPASAQQAGCAGGTGIRLLLEAGLGWATRTLTYPHPVTGGGLHLPGHPRVAAGRVCRARGAAGVCAQAARVRGAGGAGGAHRGHGSVLAAPLLLLLLLLRHAFSP